MKKKLYIIPSILVDNQFSVMSIICESTKSTSEIDDPDDPTDFGGSTGREDPGTGVVGGAKDRGFDYGNIW